MIRPTSTNLSSLPVAAQQIRSADRPVANPEDLAEVNTSAPRPQGSADFATAVSATTAAAVPGALGATLAQRMAGLPVTYVLQRKWRLPFMSPTVEVPAEKAARNLDTGRLSVQLDNKLHPIGPKDVLLLEVMHHDVGTSGLDAPDLADSLKQLQKSGLRFSIDGLAAEGFIAYRHLSGNEKAEVEVRHGELLLGRVKNDGDVARVTEKAAQAEALLSDPMGALLHLTELFPDKVERVASEMKRLAAKGPGEFKSLVTAFEKTSGKPAERAAAMKTLGDRVQHGTYAERLEFLGQIDYLGESPSWSFGADLTRLACQTYDALMQAGSPARSATEACAACLAWTDRSSYHSRRNPDTLHRLQKLVGLSPDALGFYARQMKANTAPERAESTTRLLARELPGTTFAQREETLAPLLDRLEAPALEAGWSAVAGQMQRGLDLTASGAALGKLLGARHAMPDESYLQQLGEHPDRLEALRKLSAAGVPGSGLTELLDQAFPRPGAVDVLVAVGSDAKKETGLAFLRALEAGQDKPEVAAQLTQLARTGHSVGSKLAEYYRDHMLSQEDATSTLAALLATRRLPLEECCRVLEELRGWTAPATLLERSKIYHSCSSNPDSYYSDKSKPALRPVIARALGVMIAHGQEPSAAATTVTSLWRRLGHDAVQSGLEYVIDQAGTDQEQLELFKDAVASHGKAPLARTLVELARQDLPGTTQSDRIAACRSLDLTRDGRPMEATYAALEAHVRAGVPLAETVTRLKELAQALPNEESDRAVETFGKLALDRTAQQGLLTLLRGGVAGGAASAALGKLVGRPELTAACAALAPLGAVRVSGKKLETLCEAVQDNDPQKLANLKRLGQACAQTHSLPDSMVSDFCEILASSAEDTETYAGLIEKKPEAADLRPLFDRLRQPAGQTTAAERLKAFGAIDGFKDESYYDRKRIKGDLQRSYYGAAEALWKTGQECTDAGRLWARLGLNAPAAGPIFDYFAGQVASLPPEERALYIELASQQVRRDELVGLFESVQKPCASSTFAERKLALGRFNRHELPTRQMMVEAYRADLEAGKTPEEALNRTLSLNNALSTRFGDDEVRHAFQFSAGLAGDPEAWQAFHDQLQAGVRPTVAGSTLESRDFQALEALHGLGKAGAQLKAEVARTIQSSLAKKLTEGGDRPTMLKTLGCLTETIGTRQMDAASVKAMMSHWEDHLSQHEEGTAALARLLEIKMTAQDAIALESVLRQATPGVTQTQKVDFLKTPYASSHYGRGYETVLNHGQPARLGMAIGLDALLKAGVPFEKARDTITLVTAKVNQSTAAGAFDFLASVAPDPDQRSCFEDLLKSNWSPPEAESIVRTLAQDAGGTTFAERAAAFASLGGLKSNNGDRSQELSELLLHDLRAGRDLSAITTSLTTTLNSIKALNESCQPKILKAYRSAPLDADHPRRESLERLLAAGVPETVALRAVAEAGSDLKEHELVHLGLAGLAGKLTPAIAERMRQSLVTQGLPGERLGELAAALAGRSATLEVVQAACDYSDSGAKGKSALYAPTIALGGPVSEAGPFVEAIEKVGPRETLPQRFELLKACILTPWNPGYGPIAANLNRFYQSLILIDKTPAEAADATTRMAKLAVGRQSFRTDQADLFRRFEKEPEKAGAWLDILECVSGELKTMEALKTAPLELLQRFPRVRKGGCSGAQAVEVLQIVNLPYGRSTREDRLAALDRLLEVNEQDQRAWYTKALTAFGSKQIVSHQCLSSLVRIYGKLTEFGRTPAQAADLVAEIYQTEQSRGISQKELHDRLAKLEEVAKLEVRTDNNSTILMDKDGKVVFSGVTLKKRQAR